MNKILITFLILSFSFDVKAGFPEHRTWGCKNCDAAFWKDTARNKAALGGLVPWKWPKD